MLKIFRSGDKEKGWKISRNLFRIAFWPTLLCRMLKRSGAEYPIVAISLYCRAGLAGGGWLSTRCQATGLCVLSEFARKHKWGYNKAKRWWEVQLSVLEHFELLNHMLLSRERRQSTQVEKAAVEIQERKCISFLRGKGTTGSHDYAVTLAV